MEELGLEAAQGERRGSAAAGRGEKPLRAHINGSAAWEPHAPMSLPGLAGSWAAGEGRHGASVDWRCGRASEGNGTGKTECVCCTTFVGVLGGEG